MVIEESVLIRADRETVWQTFTDVSCWRDWNRTACDAASPAGRIREGDRISFCLRPYALPVTIEVTVDEVVKHEHVVWSGSRFGVRSRHEFFFQQAANGVLVTSRETFTGLPLLLGGAQMTGKVGRELVAKMLRELKAACEEGSAPSS